MLAELCKAIIVQYNLITYDGGLLKDTAPIYFGTAPDGKAYPFTTFWFLLSNINFTTCSDLNNIPLQFSIFNNTKSPDTVLLLLDALVDGYNDVVLASLDGTQVRVDPVGTRVIQRENEGGHQGIAEFKYLVEKTR